MNKVRLALAVRRPIAITVAMLATVSLGGYIFAVESIYRPLLNGPASHPLTLVVALLLALAIVLPGRRVSIAVAGLAGLLCGLRLLPVEMAQTLFNALTPFQATVRHDLESGLPNSMGLNTAGMFGLIALAIILYRLGQMRASQLTGFVSLAFPMAAITGYAYGLQSFYGAMSLMTITLGAPLAIAVALMSANRGMLRAILSPYVTGRIARIQVALGLVVPIISGYLLLKSVDSATSTGLFGIFVVTISWFIILLVTISSVVHERVDHARRLHERAVARMATIDPLTGVFNRRYFDICCETEIQRCRRTGQPVSLLMIDIDHFKRVNDTGGHPKGDEILKAVAQIMKNNIRMTDVLGRWGGEEFALLLPNSTEENAIHVAEGLCHLVERTRFCPWAGHDGAITISVGCATLTLQASGKELVGLADAALYAAKAGGRNRVAFSPEDMSPQRSAPASRAALA